MQRKTFIAVVPPLFFVVFLFGCTTTHYVQNEGDHNSVSLLNTAFAQEEVFMLTKKGERIRVLSATLRDSSITWYADDGASNARHLSEIQQIYYEKMGRGVLWGLGIGSAVATATLLDKGASGAQSINVVAAVSFIIEGFILGAIAEANRKYNIYEAASSD